MEFRFKWYITCVCSKKKVPKYCGGKNKAKFKVWLKNFLKVASPDWPLNWNSATQPRTIVKITNPSNYSKAVKRMKSTEKRLLKDGIIAKNIMILSKIMSRKVTWKFQKKVNGNGDRKKFLPYFAVLPYF